MAENREISTEDVKTIAGIAAVVLGAITELASAMAEFIKAGSEEGLTAAEREALRQRIRDRGEAAERLRDELLAAKNT